MFTVKKERCFNLFREGKEDILKKSQISNRKIRRWCMFLSCHYNSIYVPKEGVLNDEASGYNSK